MSTYWPGLYSSSGSAQHQPVDVVSQRLERLDAHLLGLQRDTVAEHLLVVVDQLDLEVGLGVGAAQQRPPLLLLVVVEREGRVLLEIDLAVEQERLAGRALALLAAVHQHQPLAEGAVQDGLVLVDFELDADRLESDLVGLAHECGAKTPKRRPVQDRSPLAAISRLGSRLFARRTTGGAPPLVLGDVRLALFGRHLVEQDVGAL